MINLNLEFDEAVIIKCQNIDFYSTKEIKGHGDMILTNKRIILQKKGFFDKVKASFDIPVNEIKKYQGLPQIKMNDLGFGNNAIIDIYTINHQYEVKFDEEEKKFAKSFISESYKLIGDQDAYDEWCQNSKFFAFNGADQIAQTLKGTYETIKDTMFPPQMSSAPCKTCGGLVSGYVGKVAKCTFCGSMQKIE